MEYAFTQFKKETMARAALRDQAISFKSSVMIAKKLRGMMSDKAIAYLDRVVEKKEAVPFTRFRDGAGHKPGLGAGKYPIKAAMSFLSLVKLGVANAENKGLGTPLKIAHILANEGSKPMHPGRERGRAMKRTHLEVVLTETEESKKREKKVKKTVTPGKPVEKVAAPDAVKAAPKAEPKADSKKEKPAPKTKKPAQATAEKAETPKPAEKSEAPVESKEKKEATAESSAPTTEAKKDGN
jgi:large subunit ribosomal protein L22